MSDSIEKRRHDIKAALRTFSMCIGGLEEGYQFDDQVAPAKIKAMRKALTVLESEAKTFEAGLDKS